MIVRHSVLLALTTALLFVYGCASTVNININSIVDPALTPPGKRYVFNSGDKNQDDLYFREFSRYFDTVLQDAGYIKVNTQQEADLDILFTFGISDGRSGVHSYASPIYDYVGGETITITEKTSGPNGQKVTTITIPSRLERVGTSIESRSYTLFNRTVSLEARLIDEQDEETPEQAAPLVWSIYVYSVGESNDLRLVMPYLAAAAAPYIGKNTGQLIAIKLKADDASVQRLKGLTPTQN